MQLSLFDEPAPTFDRERTLAQRLPRGLFLGTSSWTFSGWSGICYPPGTSEKALLDRGLEIYARYPLFGTVGIDRSYYAPLADDALTRYAAQLPRGFRCVIKAFSAITTAADPRTLAPNPTFFSADALEAHVLGPLRRSFSGHVGAVVLEFAPMRGPALLHPLAFAERLDELLSQVAPGLPLAVELRNRSLLTPHYLDVLRRNKAAHVLNYWEDMPEIGQQLDLGDVLTADHVVCRALIPPGLRYDDRKRDLAPFDRVRDPRPTMRQDIVRLARLCEALGKELFVVVNNKAEGSSPLTIRALAELLARE